MLISILSIALIILTIAIVIVDRIEKNKYFKSK